MAFRAFVSKCDSCNCIIWGWQAQRWVTDTYKTERNFWKYAVPHTGRWIVELLENPFATYGRLSKVIVVQDGVQVAVLEEH